MPARNPASWWRHTGFQALGATLGFLAFSAFALALAISPGRQVLAALPIGQFAGAIVAPIAIVMLTHWLAQRQEQLDRAYSVWEGG